MKEDRNYGIDLLRIIAMLYVVMGHSLGQGGLLFACDPHGVSGLICWFLYTLTDSCINIFAMISGYVGYKDGSTTLHPGRAVDIWLQTVYYGVLTAWACSFLIDAYTVTAADYVSAIMPVSHNTFWYTKAYIGMFIFCPFINAGVKCINNNLLKASLVIMFILYSVTAVFMDDIFWLHKGYTPLWLLLMYAAGAILKKTKIVDDLKWGWIALISIICILSPMIWAYQGISISAVGGNKELNWDFLYDYISPFLVILAIMHIAAFQRIHVAGCIRRSIVFITPSVYAVYLINASPQFYDMVLDGATVFLSERNPVIMISEFILINVLFVAIAILLDKIRIILFKVCRLSKLCLLIDDAFATICA